MNKFDDTLQAFLQDMDDQQKQSQFFDLFLNTTLYMPTFEVKEEDEESEQKRSAPLVLSAEERDYLMLFDTEERLKEWAQQEEVLFVAVPGHVLATNTPAALHWMLNYGCEPSKEFTPEEIVWLQKAVAFSKAQASVSE